MKNTITTIKISTLIIIFSVISLYCKKEIDDIPDVRRIISLSPFITEIIYALGAENDLVAVTDYCKFPEDAKKKTKIGGLLDPNIEKIVALKPSYILGQPAHSKLNQMLEKFDLKVIMMPNEDVNDIFNAIKKIGFIIHYQDQADKLVASIRDSLHQIQEKISPLVKGIRSHMDNRNLMNEEDQKWECRDSIKAMLIVGREKGSLRNITVAGNNTFLGQMWQLAGGKNLYPDLPARYSIVSLESILIRNPDVIIEFDPGGMKQVKRVNISSEWEIFDKVNAIKNGNLYLVSGNHAFIPGPRLYLVAKDFNRIIAGIKKAE